MSNPRAHALLFEPRDEVWAGCREAAIRAVAEALPRDALGRAANHIGLDGPDPRELSWTLLRGGSVNHHPWFAERGLVTGEVVWFQPSSPGGHAPIRAALEGVDVPGVLGVAPVDAEMRHLPIQGLLVEGVYLYLGGRLDVEDEVPCVFPSEGLQWNLLSATADDPQAASSYVIQLLARAIRNNFQPGWRVP